MNKTYPYLVPWFLLISIVPSDFVRADDVQTEIQTILKVGKAGAGHAAGVPALKLLVGQKATALIPILRGMDQANPLAENWLRGAFEAIADRSLKEGTPLPKAELEQFVQDRTHGPQSRKLAFDWLLRLDPSASDRLVPRMIDDPSAEFRRESVQRLIDAAAKAGDAKDAASKALYRQAFSASLDPDQLEVVTKVLSKAGEKMDLKRHLGLLDDWWLIGPNHFRTSICYC